MKKVYAVAVYDSTCNVMGKEMGIYGKGDYSWVTDSLNGGDGAEYNMTKAEAEEVKADFERMIKEYMLDWASVEVDEMEIDEDDDEDDGPRPTIKIQDVLDTIRKDEAGVMSIVAKEARRYSSAQEQTWNGTLFTKKYANRQDGDEVIQTGNKETNLSEVKRVLTYLVGKGLVQVRLLNANWMEGEVVA